MNYWIFDNWFILNDYWIKLIIGFVKDGVN